MGRHAAGFLASILSISATSPGPSVEVPAFRPGKPAGRPTGPPLAYSSADERLAYSADAREVWIARDGLALDPSPSPHAPTIRTRYFLQDFGGEVATLRYEMRGTYQKDVISVLPDRTLVLSYATRVTYVDPDGRSEAVALEIDGEPAHILAGFADGALVRPYVLNGPAPVDFVPYRGRRLDSAARVRLVGAEPFSGYDPGRFLRAGSLVAWGDHASDLGDGRRTDFPVRKGTFLRAFDGRTAVYDDVVIGMRRAFSAADGREVSASKKARWDDRDFAVHGRVVYTFSRPPRRPGEPPVCEVIASGLAPAPGLPRSLLSIPPVIEPPARGMMGGGPRVTDPPATITAGGLRIWVGDRWEDVPWLDGPPGERPER